MLLGPICTLPHIHGFLIGYSHQQFVSHCRSPSQFQVKAALLYFSMKIYEKDPGHQDHHLHLPSHHFVKAQLIMWAFLSPLYIRQQLQLQTTKTRPYAFVRIFIVICFVVGFIRICCARQDIKLGFLYLLYYLMGNSKAKPGIFINVNKQFYFPGEEIQGNVFINAPKPYPSSKVLLTFTGHEKTFWKSPQTKNKKQLQQTLKNSPSVLTDQFQVATRASSKQDLKNIGGDKFGDLRIIEKSYTLAMWSNEYNIHGQYAFPFAFHLPSFIPASFSSQTSKYKANISYEMICTCISTNKQHQDVSEKKQITIRIPHKADKQSIYGQLFLRPKNWGCISQGVSKISCYFAKNQYQVNEECIAYCQIDNYKCKAKIQQIKTKLNKLLTLKSARGEEITFSEVLNQSKFQGIQAYAQYLGENAQKICIPLKHKNSTSPIAPTTKGELINCWYQLQVIPILAGGCCCCKNRSQFTVGIQIVQPGTQQEKLEAPPGWNPQVFKKSDIYVEQTLRSNYKLDRMNDPQY